MALLHLCLYISPYMGCFSDRKEREREKDLNIVYKMRRVGRAHEKERGKTYSIARTSGQRVWQNHRPQSYPNLHHR